MISVQEMCGRIGIVTGKGLTRVLKEHYPKGIVYFVVMSFLLVFLFMGGYIVYLQGKLFAFFEHLNKYFLIFPVLNLALQNKYIMAYFDNFQEF